MYIRTRGIVLNHLKYGETSLIVRVFTEYAGLQSFIVKGVRVRKNNGKISLFQPLTLIEIELPEQNKSDLLVFKDARLLYNYTNISTTIEKHCIFIFLSEVLNKILCMSQSEKAIFGFVYNSLISLDQVQDSFSYFHLTFLINFTTYLGIKPMDLNSLNNLQAILEYYGQHIPDFLPIHSPAVLHTVLH